MTDSNPRGHVWMLATDGLGNPDPHGDVDMDWPDWHTGRICERCKHGECILCRPTFLTEDCPDFGTELAGLELTNPTAPGEDTTDA